MLANYGIQTQTPTEVEPVQIWPPGELVRLLTSMGKSTKLGLNGRPARPVGRIVFLFIFYAIDYFLTRVAWNQ